MASALYPDHTLAQFRRVQRIAYDSAEAVARSLQPGVTEKQAAAMLADTLRQRGVRGYFHRPFAWFGERTMFAGFRSPLDFFPTQRALQRGDPAILDVAPVMEGHAADIGYTFSLEKSRKVEVAIADLEVFRTLILEQVLAERTLRDIYRAVDAVIAELGYVNCHQRYPFAVLAHKVDKVASRLSDRLPSLLGFGPAAALPLLGGRLAALFGGARRTPLWNGTASSNVRAEPGLWAVEPHIGRDGVGAKWEELLVVTESSAYWLDDDLPHVRAWQQPAGRPQPVQARR